MRIINSFFQANSSEIRLRELRRTTDTPYSNMFTCHASVVLTLCVSTFFLVALTVVSFL